MSVATFVVVTAYGLQWFFNCVWESEGSGKWTFRSTSDVPKEIFADTDNADDEDLDSDVELGFRIRCC